MLRPLGLLGVGAVWLLSLGTLEQDGSISDGS